MDTGNMLLIDTNCNALYPLIGCRTRIMLFRTRTNSLDSFVKFVGQLARDAAPSAPCRAQQLLAISLPFTSL
eukprot:41400-Pelagomonas_calceolata.AAC.1